jgi:PAS domain S-box-containing protein
MAQDGKPHVLVVDDEPRILDSLCRLLEESFEVVSSPNPMAALDLLRVAQFAVILADQRMPGLTGDQFLAKAQGLSDATRILVTGYTDIEALIRAVNQGQIHTYVSKPWDPEQLRVIVLDAANHCRETIRQKRAAEQLEEQQQALAVSEAAFRRQTKLLQSILDSMGDGVLATDENGKMVLLNPAAQSMVGLDPTRVPPDERSQRLGIFRPGTEDLYPADEMPLARAMRGETVDGIELYIRNAANPDGMFVSVNVRPLKDDLGEGRGGVAVVHDITPAKRSEEQLRRAKEEAERANHAKSEFLSRMSHELRTPLNSILGFAQVLEMGALQPDDLGPLEQILKGGEHLLTLINEVLDVARIESGRMALSLEPVLVAEVMQQALGLIRPLAEQREVTIGEAWDGCHYVRADRQRLRQVLLNLLSNAIKYNLEGGHIEVACQTRDNGFVRIAISDTGLGVSPENRAKLFRPFERLVGDSTAVEGTGLGLALSKGLVEAMEGVIGVDGNPGGGSIFWIDLRPADRPQDPWLDLDVAYQRDTIPEPAQRRVVLYIEDNPSNLALMQRIAGLRPDVELMAAEQGDLGLDLARAHCPDLILLDLHLPDMPGLEVLQRLRRNPETRSIPVVVVSADATPEHIQQLLAAGARSYVTKPFDISSILRLFDETAPGESGPALPSRYHEGVVG